MNRRKFLKAMGASLMGPVLWSGCGHSQASSGSGTLHDCPNFVIILTDNMGYGDLACYGSKANLTPQIDKMALEGMRFTSFYSSSGVSTPSRASLMTG